MDIPLIDFETISFVILASVLACIALLTGSVPILVGAMVIAPTFDSIAAISFGVVNRDWAQFKVGVSGILILFAISFCVCLLTVWGLATCSLLPGHAGLVTSKMITQRLTMGGYTIIVALAAGGAGALASAANRLFIIVGVAIALSLVPALAAVSHCFCALPLFRWLGWYRPLFYECCRHHYCRNHCAVYSPKKILRARLPHVYFFISLSPDTG